MFQRLASHNKDLKRLLDKGYAITADGGYLVVRDIPYLDDQKCVQTGAIVCKLVFVKDDEVVQDDHQIFFAGSVPHAMDGSPIPNLGGGLTGLALNEASADVVVQRSFSNKPQATGRFADFFEKIESYVTIISGPAMELHGATPYTFRSIPDPASNSVFRVQDTLTSRAEITDLSARFKEDVVAIIGLGGTGSYVLDFLVKTPVREIRGFDPDTFHVHTAFRSPGCLDKGELGMKKADVYQTRYDGFRPGLSLIPKFVDAGCATDLEGVTFAFVCVDSGASRAGIFDLLISKGIPFIDVGMDLNRKHGPIGGMLRTTYYSTEQGPERRDKGLALLADSDDDVYRTNIQIGELNALNACLAVIKFKQLRGFYLEGTSAYHLLFGVGDLMSYGKSDSDED